MKFLNIRDKLRMDYIMVWEYKDGKLVVNIKDNLKMVREKEKEFSI